MPILVRVIPVAVRAMSSRLWMFWSSILLRVITVTDCGVSRRLRASLVAVLVEPVVYEPVPSVEPRANVPRVVRDDARYQTAVGEQRARREQAGKAEGAK